MGVYSDYLAQHLTPDQLGAERQRQLARISARRGRDILLFASDIQSAQPVSIAYADILAFRDQLTGRSGQGLDVVLETPGGSTEVVEDILMMVRTKYPSVGVIVPGVVRGAGTIFAMGADEILMDGTSALGPIDPHVPHQGTAVSAQALIDGVRRIRDEAARTGVVNAADTMILQNVSPAELQLAEHAVTFARDLVTGWLARYHLHGWTTDDLTGAAVTTADRQARAQAIADELRDRTRWTHGPITMADLRRMGLTVTDVAEDPELGDAVQRCSALLHITFASGIYKIFETPHSRIVREPATAAASGGQRAQAKAARLTIECSQCGASVKIHAPFAPGLPVPPDAMPFPAGNIAVCPSCGHELHLAEAREQIEAQARQAILTAD